MKQARSMIKTARCASTGIVLILSIHHAFAASFTFNTALPVSKNEVIIREQLIVNKASNVNMKRRETTLVSTFV